jgi:hypothetical protein
MTLRQQIAASWSPVRDPRADARGFLPTNRRMKPRGVSPGLSNRRHGSSNPQPASRNGLGRVGDRLLVEVPVEGQLIWSLAETQRRREVGRCLGFRGCIEDREVVA